MWNHGRRSVPAGYFSLIKWNYVNKKITFVTLRVSRAPYEMTKILFRGLSHRCGKNE
jgi:hypothetical protein